MLDPTLVTVEHCRIVLNSFRLQIRRSHALQARGLIEKLISKIRNAWEGFPRIGARPFALFDGGARTNNEQPAIAGGTSNRPSPAALLELASTAPTARV